jgi:hypothetical protein
MAYACHRMFVLITKKNHNTFILAGHTRDFGLSNVSFAKYPLGIAL